MYIDTDTIQNGHPTVSEGQYSRQIASPKQHEVPQLPLQREAFMAHTLLAGELETKGIQTN